MTSTARIGAGLLQVTKAEEIGNIVTGTLKPVADILCDTLKGRDDVVHYTDDVANGCEELSQPTKAAEGPDRLGG
jgi:hypothetical protein